VETDVQKRSCSNKKINDESDSTELKQAFRICATSSGWHPLDPMVRLAASPQTVSGRRILSVWRLVKASSMSRID
jgi:hypothetical protein